MEKLKLPINNGWMPDIPLEEITKNQGLYKSINVLPIKGAYYPVNDKSDYNDTAAADNILTGTYIQDSSGIYYNFIGTSTKLYRYTETTLTDITRESGGDYAAARWCFVEYGNWLIASNFFDNIQILKDLESGNFAELSGSPPKAKFMLVVSGHLILAHLNDGNTKYPKKIQWSAREDVEDYTTSLTTGADSQDFPDMQGNITGLGSLGDAFVIAAENSLTIGYYVGGTYTYNFKINAIKNIGCYYPESFISIGDRVFFWSKDSIYMFDGSNTPVEIGRYIKYSIFTEAVERYGHRITATHDKSNGLILWTYPSTLTSSHADKILVYNYLENKFTIIDISCDSVFLGATGGFLSDSFTDTLVDDLDELIDNDYWLNNSLTVMIGDIDYKINTFSGDVLDAEIETGEIASHPNILRITKMHLPIEGSGANGSAIIKTRNSLLDSQINSSEISIKKDGTIDCRATARYLSLNINASNFNKINNIIDIDMANMGER